MDGVLAACLDDKRTLRQRARGKCAVALQIAHNGQTRKHKQTKQRERERESFERERERKVFQCEWLQAAHTGNPKRSSLFAATCSGNGTERRP